MSADLETLIKEVRTIDAHMPHWCEQYRRLSYKIHTTEDEERRARLEAHRASVDAHIKQLKNDRRLYMRQVRNIRMRDAQISEHG